MNLKVFLDKRLDGLRVRGKDHDLARALVAHLTRVVTTVATPEEPFPERDTDTLAQINAAFIHDARLKIYMQREKWALASVSGMTPKVLQSAAQTGPGLIAMSDIYAVVAGIPREDEQTTDAVSLLRATMQYVEDGTKPEGTLITLQAHHLFDGLGSITWRLPGVYPQEAKISSEVEELRGKLKTALGLIAQRIENLESQITLMGELQKALVARLKGSA